MPPPENTPADPQDANNPPAKPEGFDIDAILLPKKEVPKSTERVNAGALLEQEQSATLLTPEGTSPNSVPATPAPPKEKSVVQPLQTYKGDIESLIKDKNVSMVSIAAAEAEKRAQAEAVETTSSSEPSALASFLRSALMILGGMALLAATAGIGVFVYLQYTATAPVPQDTPAPFMNVDNTTVVAIPKQDLTRAALMQQLERAKQGNTVSLGLIDRLLPASSVVQAEGDVATAIPADLFLLTLAPNVPDELVRTLAKEFLLGVHVFDGPQAFIILKTDSYEHAFAAMLAWEGAMKDDLAPLFTRNPRPRIPEENVSAAPLTATSTSSTTPVQLSQTGFIDTIVENRDARAIRNETGDLLLLWTFLDRNTLVITTNEYTLKELITRLSAPVTQGL